MLPPMARLHPFSWLESFPLCIHTVFSQQATVTEFSLLDCCKQGCNKPGNVIVFSTVISFPLASDPRVGIVGSYGMFSFHFRRNHYAVFHNGYTNTATTMCKPSVFSVSLMDPLLDDSQSNWSEATAGFAFSLWLVKPYPFSHFVPSFVSIPLRNILNSTAHFKNWVFELFEFLV